MRRVLDIDLDTDFTASLRAIPGSLALTLIGMALIDVAFILVSADQDYRGARTSLHVSVDHGIAEHWQYLKWGALALLLSFLAASRRMPVYFVWALLFLYLLIDDSHQIHEGYGAKIAESLGLQPAFGLRTRDFGELAVTAIACIPLFGALALTYIFGSGQQERIFTHTMIALVILLAFFGVGVDMLDNMMPWEWLVTALTIIEDGAEMIVATAMVAYAIGAVVRERERIAEIEIA